MPAESPKGVRELPSEAAAELPGVWVTAGLGDPLSELPSVLGCELVVDDALLVGSALSGRGASLPRLSRRFVRVAGHGYHAFVPLARAARSLVPIDAPSLALAIASEVRDPARALAPEHVKASGLSLGHLMLRVRRSLATLERGVLRHERDAAQHYRWLLEMDLGILPDDALGTTLEECLAIQRASRRLELEATLDLLGTFGVLLHFAERQSSVNLQGLAVAALVPDALELPSATPALALSSVAHVNNEPRAAGASLMPSAAFSEFLEGFGERAPREVDPFAPRWRERPELLARVGELLARDDVDAYEARLARERRAREVLLVKAADAFGPVDSAVFNWLLTSTRKLVLLRSRLHLVRARTLAMLRTTVLDIDRRLSRLIGSAPNAAFFLETRELLDSTVRPRPELAAVARERRAEWDRARQEPPPPAVLGRAASRADDGAPLTGIGLGNAEVVGTVLVASRFEHALDLPPGGVLVTRALDASWAPLFLGAGAIVTDAGGVTDEGTVAGCALGVPLVLGTGQATTRLKTGEAVRVDARKGTVEPCR